MAGLFFLLGLFSFFGVVLIIAVATAVILWQNRAFPWARRTANVLVCILWLLCFAILNSLIN